MKDIVVTYHHEPEGFWADAQGLDGFVAAGRTLAEVRDLVREGIPVHLGDEAFDLYEQIGDSQPAVVVDIVAPAPFAVAAVVQDQARYFEPRSVSSAPVAVDIVAAVGI